MLVKEVSELASEIGRNLENCVVKRQWNVLAFFLTDPMAEDSGTFMCRTAVEYSNSTTIEASVSSNKANITIIGKLYYCHLEMMTSIVGVWFLLLLLLFFHHIQIVIVLDYQTVNVMINVSRPVLEELVVQCVLFAQTRGHCDNKQRWIDL